MKEPSDEHAVWLVDYALEKGNSDIFEIDFIIEQFADHLKNNLLLDKILAHSKKLNFIFAFYAFPEYNSAYIIE